MIDADIQGLVERVEAFRFDEGEPRLTFAARLAREQGWTEQFTARAIAEYRRFAVLAVAAGHPVSPSTAVDEVWHLHLIYTRSYWDRFCSEVLRTKLHHNPTAGGPAEHFKHLQQYSRTLESYQQVFGVDPPKDLWPTPARQYSVSSGSRWKGRLHLFMQRMKRLVAFAFMLLALSGCQGQNWQAINVFDWPGKKFLAFYFVLLAIAIAAGAILRRGFTRPEIDDNQLEQLEKHPYLLSTLAGGPRLTIATAMVKMMQEGTLRTVERGASKKVMGIAIASPRNSLAKGSAVADDAPQLEKTVHLLAGVAGEVEAKEIIDGSLPVVQEYEDYLQEEGLLEDPDESWSYRRVPVTILVAVLAIGVGKFAVGLARNKPVQLLFYLLVACIVAIVFMAKKRRTTPRGSQIVSELRSRHRSLRDRVNSPEETAIVPLMLATGLFGVAALKNNAVASQTFHVLRDGGELAAAGGMADSSTGCSGGGGCGGGGCGGCGGD
ncbi:TIGR04222 domain-containing membrane protein [Planctomicrobium sp. SH664]|uniref:TIGR04222 domain-containing membrane protein n=1 Tax=Planctomicrobium sp. SH664 TaxID=3448125 RepID=UPI003F5C8C5A